MQKSEIVTPWQRPIPLSILLLAAVVVHLPLMLMELPLRSYDTNFHILFASHYLHHWFNPWNTKWYVGFSQMTYPPLPQQWVAVLSHLLGLDFAYMAVQLVAILLLVVGVYRFAKLWVSPRAASYAAMAFVVLGSESFLVYNAGQLGTTSAAPLYMNGLPFLYEWIRYGRFRSFLKGAALFVAAAAAHHATLLFGSFFYALPVVALAYMERNEGEEKSSSTAITARTIGIVTVVAVSVAVVLLPFWIALIKYPVTQTPIPHASRANYILTPHWGFNYFVVPYGTLILAFPFLIWRGATVRRLRPLLFGFWLAFMLGLGGTTPMASWVLRRAFEVLTMERFSYWATLLCLPILGALAVDWIDRWRMKAAAVLIVGSALNCALAIGWGTWYPPEITDFKVDQAANWLSRDGHDKYTYITLGFGNEIARLALETTALSEDGEWNSGRLLPELMAHGGAALTNSRGYGKNGMDGLRAILDHADIYGLKWVLVRDPYYNTLLAFAGWRPVDSLDNNTIVIWGKDGVPPYVPHNQAQIPPRWQGILWGTLPFGSSIVAILLMLIPGSKRASEDEDEYQYDKDTTLVHGRMAS